MARKIIALVLAALMMSVSGCSGQLNEEKYYEKLTDNIREYLVLSDDVFGAVGARLGVRRFSAQCGDRPC